jgi:hypothetical protein
VFLLSAAFERALRKLLLNVSGHSITIWPLGLAGCLFSNQARKVWGAKAGTLRWWDPGRYGALGGPARATSLTPAQRAEIARMAAEARWKKKR